MALPAVSQTAEVATRDSGPEAVAEMLRLAIEKGIPVEALERLEALYERMADRAAAQEFAVALAAFQRDCPPIRKTSTAKITTKNGPGYTYRYAELDEIARTAGPILSAHGLSYTWDSETRDGVLQCRATLRHVNGHSVTATFTLPVDNPSAMSNQQKHAAALTYARRQSLIQVLGLTTTDPDTDGAEGPGAERITEDQAVHIEDQIKETKVDRARFLKWMGVASVTEIAARDYERAVNALARKVAP